MGPLSQSEAGRDTAPATGTDQEATTAARIDGGLLGTLIAVAGPGVQRTRLGPATRNQVMARSTSQLPAEVREGVEQLPRVRQLMALKRSPDHLAALAPPKGEHVKLGQRMAEQS